MTGTMTLMSLLPIIVVGLIALAGLVLLVRGIRGEADLSFPGCAGCGYDLRGRDLTAVAACPECGKSLSEPRAVHFGRYRRKPRMMMLGAAMIVAPVLVAGIVVFISVQRTRRMGPMGVSAQSTAQIIQALPQTANQPWGWNELSSRYATRQLSDEEIAAAIDQLIAYLKTVPPSSTQPMSWSQSFVESALNGGHLSKEQTGRLYDAYFGSPPAIQLPKRIRSGQVLQFTASLGSVWNSLPGVQTIAAMRSVQFDGRAIRTQPDPLSASGPMGISAQLKVDATPGPHVFTFDCEVGLVEAELADLNFFHRPGLPEQWPKTLRRWSHTVSVPVQIVGPDEPTVELVNDPAQAQAIREAVSIRHVRVVNGPGGMTVKFIVSPDKSSPVPLSYDLIMAFEGKEVKVGNFWWGPDGHLNANRFECQVDLPDSVNAVQMRLRPNPTYVESSPNIDRIWGGEVVFENVPVVRE